MKKSMLLALLALMVAAAMILAGCGGGGNSEDLANSKYVGTWKVADMALGDESEAVDQSWILTLKEDGTGTFVSESDNESSDFTWELTKDGFKTKGDVKLKFKDDGEKISTKIMGVSLIFEKQ